MAKFKFIRRQCEVECYNRAKKLLESITIPTLRARLEKVIAEYETKSKIIELFENHPNLEERTRKDGEKEYVLPMRFVSLVNDKYQIVEGKISCGPAHRENYVESWRNIGTEHHSLYVDYQSDRSQNGYWLCNEDTLEQMLSQDTLEERIPLRKILPHACSENYRPHPQCRQA